jgi:hypothetical protein
MIQVTPIRHRALGPLLRLDGAGPVPLELTPQEAQTIARALEAVRDGRSRETQIFLSPIASDGEFQAQVEADGIRLGDVLLPWPQVGELARLLAEGAP